MKCPKCQSEIKIALASRLKSAGCKVLAKPSTIVTIQCESCGNIFQAALSGEVVFSVKKDEDKI